MRDRVEEGRLCRDRLLPQPFEVAREVDEGGADHPRVLRRDGVENRLHLAGHEREADDPPGEPRAIEVPDRERVPVPLDRRGQLQRALLHRRKRVTGEARPEIEVDVPGDREPVQLLELLERRLGVAAEHSIGGIERHAKFLQALLGTLHKYAASPAAEERPSHRSSLLPEYPGRSRRDPLDCAWWPARLTARPWARIYQRRARDG